MKNNYMNIYLNAADGRKERKLSSLLLSSTENSKYYRQASTKLRKILSLDKADDLFFSQNATSNLIQSLFPILNKEKNTVLISSHEVKWLTSLFRKGKLPLKTSTRPNYAKLNKTDFLHKAYRIFEPNDLDTNLDGVLRSKRPIIIIISHVSRMTGELLMTPEIYRKIKSANRKNIVVVDGSQAVGAIPVKVKDISDIYIGVTSKFIGAEPHLSFCWVRKDIQTLYDIKPWEINVDEFSKEIYSANVALDKLLKSERETKQLRKYLERKLDEKSVPIWKTPSQIDNMLLIPAKKIDLIRLIEDFQRRGVCISSNTNWSINEPEVACLRVSISKTTTKKELDYFVSNLGELH